KKKAELQKAADDYKKNELPALLQKWEDSLKPEERKNLPANIAAVLAMEPEGRDAKQQKALADYYAKQDKKLTSLTKAVTDHDRKAPKAPVAQMLALGRARKTHVLIRGDFLRPGVEVQPGTPAVLPPLQAHGPRPVGLEQLTRLDLAKWLVSPDNP